MAATLRLLEIKAVGYRHTGWALAVPTTDRLANFTLGQK